MGCFNQTCGISNLPIRVGEPVVLFILSPNAPSYTGGSGPCNPTDVFHPCFIPVFGEYDDYGGIQNIEPGPSALLKDVLIDLVDSDMRYSNTNKEDSHWPSANLERLINDVLSSGNLLETLVYPRGVTLAMGHVMFHREIYQAVLDEVGREPVYGKSLNLWQHEMEKAFEMLAMPAIDRMLLLDRRPANGMFNIEVFRAVEKTIPADALSGLIADYNVMERAMEHLRKTWVPQGGQGCQGAEYSLFQKVWEVGGRIIERNENPEDREEHDSGIHP